MENGTESLSVAPEMQSDRAAAVLLTPGRTRNIAQDMEALRMSRQDNPYLQQVIASRESLIEEHLERCESDNAELMSQDFSSSTPLDFIEDDPVTLKEVHDHMIRSPPPISCWPHDVLSCRASSAFDFSAGTLSYSAYSVDSDQEKGLLNTATAILRNSPLRLVSRAEERTSNRVRSAGRSVSPRGRDLREPRDPRDPQALRPLSLPGESHLKSALGRCVGGPGAVQYERFSLLRDTTNTNSHDECARLVSHLHHSTQ